LAVAIVAQGNCTVAFAVVTATAEPIALPNISQGVSSGTNAMHVFTVAIGG
jgi:hypothetical protein